MHFRFSGHESFPCRYTWLPKAYQEILSDPGLFNDDNKAMVRLGVGKNMVRSIRFWVQAFGIAKPGSVAQTLKPTTFGTTLLAQNGLDPFLEDNKTLWILHWKVSTAAEPLFAWHLLLNQWADPTFSKSEVVNAFTRESDRMDRPLSDSTKEQHFDIFLRTYLASRSKHSSDVLEDSLDCPLTELNFISPAGERILDESGKREPVYEFRQEEKMDVTNELFAYCLFDFWRTNRSKESTMSFKDVSSSTESVGQVFKLSELAVRNRLESLKKYSGGLFDYLASAATPLVMKHGDLTEKEEVRLLKQIYATTPGKSSARRK